MLTQEARCATAGPERPRVLDDVGIWLFYDRRGARAESTYIAGSVTADRYITVPESKLPAIRAFIERLDGNRTLDEIHRELVRECGFEVDVRALHRKFARAGLLAETSGPSSGDIQRMSATFLQVRLDPLLRLLQVFAVLAKPLLFIGAALMTAAVIVCLTTVSVPRLAFRPASVRVTAWIVAASVLAHELSHCFAAARWGIRSGKVRVQLYLGVIPVVGLKLRGLYTLPASGRLAV
jgi:hypothetical protein